MCRWAEFHLSLGFRQQDSLDLMVSTSCGNLKLLYCTYCDIFYSVTTYLKWFVLPSMVLYKLISIFPCNIGKEETYSREWMIKATSSHLAQRSIKGIPMKI